MATSTPSIYPALRYRDANAAVEWLERAFGFERLMVVPGEGGGVGHAELQLGNGVVMLGSFVGERASDGYGEIGTAPMTIYIVVDDPDGHYKRAKSAGAEIIRELENMDYGSREYSARDLEGYIWSFGTYVPDLKGGSNG
ncbi:MAG TPA: VOC family protein [Dehalococcoidia bacterium]|nr:VOC family protein [Dehalococcoidia bacterium]